MGIRFRERPMKGLHSRAISVLPPRFSSIGVRLALHNQPICQQALQVRGQPTEVAGQEVRLIWQPCVSQHDCGASPASSCSCRTSG